VSELRFTAAGLSREEAERLGNELTRRYFPAITAGTRITAVIVSDGDAAFERDVLAAARHFRRPPEKPL
jgi:hypothetical protein